MQDTLMYIYVYRDVQLIYETHKMPLGSHRGEYFP